MMIKFVLDGQEVEAKADELLIDLLLRNECKIPCVCYHHQLGPIQTCDTCMVEVNGQLGARLRHEGYRRDAGGNQVHPGRRRAAGSLRPSAQGPHALLHGLRQQQRQLHDAQHDQDARGGSSENSIHSPSRTRSTPRTLFTGTIRTSASFAAAVSRPARTSRSTKRSPSTGRIRTRACCGTAESRSANRVASPAAIA